MIRESIQTGRTTEEAIEAACRELELERDQVEFEIIDLPKKGFLGLKNTPAKVRVYVEIPEQSKSQVAVTYLKEVLAEMGLTNIEIAVQEEDNNAVLTLTGEGLGVIIGRRGETLDALQYLAGLVANRVEGDYVRITIDSGNYREKREKTLEALARKLANNAVKTGRSSTLEPMNPYERRIIHAAVSTVEGATSTSVGEEPNRRVVISSTNPAPRRSGGNRGGYNNSRGGYNRGNRGPRTEGGDRGGYKGKPRGGDRRPPRGERSAYPQPTVDRPTRPAPPAEAEGKPLYGKIDLD